MDKCHICGKETDWICRDCDEFVCEDCTMTYNQFTQIDYTLCTICGCHDDNYYEKSIKYKRLKKVRNILKKLYRI